MNDARARGRTPPLAIFEKVPHPTAPPTGRRVWGIVWGKSLPRFENLIISRRYSGKMVPGEGFEPPTF